MSKERKQNPFINLPPFEEDIMDFLGAIIFRFSNEPQNMRDDFN